MASLGDPALASAGCRGSGRRRGYEEYADLPEDAPVRVYALEEIAVEKLVALTDRARNEPRDLYDLWHLASEGLVDFSTLVPEVEAKLAFRGRTRDAMTTELATKEARYKKLWAVRQASAGCAPGSLAFFAVAKRTPDRRGQGRTGTAAEREPRWE